MGGEVLVPLLVSPVLGDAVVGQRKIKGADQSTGLESEISSESVDTDKWR